MEPLKMGTEEAPADQPHFLMKLALDCNRHKA